MMVPSASCIVTQNGLLEVYSLLIVFRTKTNFVPTGSSSPCRGVCGAIFVTSAGDTVADSLKFNGDELS